MFMVVKYTNLSNDDRYDGYSEESYFTIKYFDNKKDADKYYLEAGRKNGYTTLNLYDLENKDEMHIDVTGNVDIQVKDSNNKHVIELKYGYH